jgi:Rad3-related DNA helicase
MPYNYLIDSHIRESLGIEIKGAIIVIDEGHNIDSVAEDASSYEIHEL